MSYISRTMALAGVGTNSDICKWVKSSGDYKWNAQGKCVQISTGAVYPGDQKNSNCVCLGPAPAQSGWAAVLDYGKSLLPQAQQQYSGPQGQPSGSLTGSGLLVPAVAVVGGVALLLMLRKK